MSRATERRDGLDGISPMNSLGWAGKLVKVVATESRDCADLVGLQVPKIRIESTI
jgi:hypothetical protein